jgi:hypothetical protein
MVRKKPLITDQTLSVAAGANPFMVNGLTAKGLAAGLDRTAGLAGVTDTHFSLFLSCFFYGFLNGSP